MPGRNIFILINRVRLKWKALKQRFYRKLEKQIMETKEKPHKVALGCALGIGVNFFPTLGLGFLLAFFLATILKVNRASATAVSLLTGPLVPLMYALNFVSGGIILAEASGRENLLEFVFTQYAMFLRVGQLSEQAFGIIELLGSTFLLGAAVNAIFFGAAFNLFIHYLLNKKIKTV